MGYPIALCATYRAETFEREMLAFPARESLAYLRDRDVGYVVVHGGLLPEGQAQTIARVLAQAPGVTAVATRRFRGGTSTLYRLGSVDGAAR